MQYVNEASAYMPKMIEEMKAAYAIDPRQFNHYNIKRGRYGRAGRRYGYR